MKNSFFFFLRRPKNWLLLLVAVSLLHLVAIAWIGGYVRWPGPRSSSDSRDNLISASLSTAEIPKTSPPQQPVRPHEMQAESAPEETAKKARPDTESVQPDNNSVSMPANAISTPGKRVSTDANKAGASSPTANAGAGTKGQDRTKYAVSAPPSARLSYRIQARRQAQNLYGSGFIDWNNDGENFSIQGESNLLLLTVFSFQSKGTINPDYGISPQIYQEKRFRKSATNTHFHPERNRISFSASTKSYPRTGGEQDRSSVVWQLAGIGRRNPAMFKPGVQFPIFVAGTRDAETWNFQVIGSEEISTEIGKVRAWHLIRKPSPESRDQTLEIWLAPDKEWYPVKLRHTDKNGDSLEMSLTEIKSVPAR